MIKLTGIPYFNQSDSKWGNEKLGTSTVATVSSDGCLLSIVAAMLCYHGKETTPGRLNDDLTRVEGWYKACRLEYGAISEIYTDITVDWNNYIDCSVEPAPLDKIDDILNSKRIPLVRVDFNPATSKLDEHWVAIIGKNEVGDYLIYDPIDGTEQWFQNRYKDPARYIFKIVVYDGPIKEVEDDSDKIKDLETQNQALSHQLEESSATIGILQGEVEKANAENGRLSTEVFVARNERRQAIWEKEKFEGENKKLTDKVSTQGDSIRALKLALKACKSDAMKNMGGFELIIKGIVKMIGR